MRARRMGPCPTDRARSRPSSPASSSRHSPPGFPSCRSRPALDAARRECWEETGIRAEPANCLGVLRYRLRRAGATRPAGESSPQFIRDWVSWGAGPRASQYLILGAKTRAMLAGRYTPAIADVRAVAPPVLRHRIVTNFAAEAENVKPDAVVRRLVEEV